MERTQYLSTIALFGGTLLLAASAAGCSHAPAQEAHPKDKVQAPVVVTLATVESRQVQRSIQAVGTLWALETVNLTAKVPGRVIDVLVDEGDRVAPGTPLLEQAKTDAQLAVDESKRSLEKELARLGLTDLPTSVYDSEKLPSISKSRTLVENFRRNRDRMKSLYDRKAITLQELEQAETSYQVEEATLRQNLLDVESWLATARHAASVLATAEKQLSDTHVVTPPFMFPKLLPANSSYVVSKRDITGGEIAVPGTALFQLVADDVLKLRATVPERYLGQVALGQTVEIHVEAYPKDTFSATIFRMSPIIDETNRSFEIEAHVQNDKHRLKQGLFAKAEILTHVDTQSITAPLEAVYTFAGVTKVFVVEGGKAHGIPVEMGARGEGWVELIGNVPVGSHVVTSGQSQLAEGTLIVERSAQADPMSAAPEVHGPEAHAPTTEMPPAATTPMETPAPMEHK